MKLSVISGKCQGHGRCYSLAPELFDVDENGNAQARQSVLDESDHSLAELAALNCPEKAIEIS